MTPARDLLSLVSQLREHLGFRCIAKGMQMLESEKRLLLSLGPGQKDAGVLLGVVAQWVDAGFADIELVQRLLARFPKEYRESAALLDYLHIRMADGLVAMTEENLDQAVQHFRFVQSLEGEITDKELLAISNFWTARCLRKTGRYDDALSYTAKGKALALECGYTQMAAVMQVLESWVAFQKGKLDEAAAILQEAEAALSETDDFVTRGNIQSAYGRIARRQARYDQALDYFEKAITEYKQRDPHHLHLARSLVNIAFVKRSIALRAQKAIDREAARRRSSAGSGRGAEEARAQLGRIERFRAEARTHLAEALEIYRRHDSHRGIASVHVNFAFLHLDAGDLERAAADAAESVRYAQDKSDYIAMARARTLQCMIENTRLEEQIGDAGHHAQLAEDFARDAVQFAKQTQNRRLLARAYVWQGLTYASEHFQKYEAGRRCWEMARELLQPENQAGEYVWEDFEMLQARIVRVGGIDPILREWSAGLVGARTFQQITEEFARIIIPKVWEREGRKVSRVASKLCVSPKKVRRILQAAGVTQRSDTQK